MTTKILGGKLEKENAKLKDLLNDESFVHWINKKATKKESSKWEQWIYENPQKQRLVKKAQKFLNMPFQNVDVKYDVYDELEKIKDKITGN